MKLRDTSLIAIAVAIGLLPVHVSAQSTSATAVSPASISKSYDARAFHETTSFRMAAAAGHVFSPDGRSILISSDKTGVFNAFALPITGGEARQITSSTKNATFAASYFPADERILFTAGQGGDELDHVYVRERDGTVRDLTPGEKTRAEFLGWAADGKRFYIYANDRDPQTFDVYAYDSRDYKRTLLFKNSGYEVSAISGDGRWLALSKLRSATDSDIYIADLKTGTPPKLITAHKGSVQHSVFDFTPDGRSLVFGTDEHGEFTQGWTYDLASDAKAPLIAADWDVMFVVHSPSGRYRVSALNDDASTALTITDLKSGQPVRLTGLPAGDIGQVRFSRDESRIALTVASDTSPADVFVADLATGQAKRLTKALNPAIDEADLVDGQVVRYVSYDGIPIPGILYKPKGASAAAPVPAVIFVHGGPGDQSRKGYSAMIQHLVNHGYAVFSVNNRGSSGYGKTFNNMDNRRHGDVDLKDLIEGKTYLQSLDWVADDKIGIMGGSYGGFLVAAALAFAPRVFDVGIDIYGVTNWVRTLTNLPPWWASMKQAIYDELGDPATDGERHRAISPLFHAKNIVKPLLIMQGANDPRVLKVESDELAAAVRSNGVPVEYVVFPDEGHGFLRRENRITASETYLRFLDKHLAAR